MKCKYCHRPTPFSLNGMIEGARAACHSGRVTGQRRVFFRVSGRVVTIVEASRFSWSYQVSASVTNAERDSSKEARS